MNYESYIEKSKSKYWWNSLNLLDKREFQILLFPCNYHLYYHKYIIILNIKIILDVLLSMCIFL